MTFWDGTRWVPDAPTGDRPHPGRRMFGAAAEALLITTLAFGLIASSALAARPNATVWVVELQGDVRSAEALSLGSAFTIGYEASAKQPWALARCYPNATTVSRGTYPDGSVWGEVFSVYEGGPAPQAFVLGESVYPLWLDGGAECVVELVTYNRDMTKPRVLATAAFSVN